MERLMDAEPVAMTGAFNIGRFIRRRAKRTAMESELGRGYDHIKAMCAILEPDEMDRIEDTQDCIPEDRHACTP